ncbi:RtcB family protein [Desulfovibrio sp. TomC]|uniref:RtcB family protein n=1 Tax=Desulfovibrio sp. TomC TaxID=1562888 RepID=UPI000574D4B6|nr:RtcB family protein [Desulfovibrio sp. TomC]KHK04465.1 Protein RtcB [Desulfovibrio sp. TomC]
MGPVLRQIEALAWELPQTGAMRTRAVFYGSQAAAKALEDGVLTQLANVTGLPGVVGPVLAMPDAHPGYGFPIGAVAAFDPEAGGVVSAGGVGFDIACGVRTLVGNLSRQDVEPVREQLADRLFARIPCGLGQGGALRLSDAAMDRMLRGGAAWAVGQGYGEAGDLTRCEEGGVMAGADPAAVSGLARKRQRDALGTLGSGNHYLEVQYIDEIYDHPAAAAYGLRRDQVAVSIHCGSRGLGHQTATDHMAAMRQAAPGHGITLPDPDLACAPIASALGQSYLGAMRAAINCALAGRQVLSHLVREVFAELFPGCRLPLLFDVSHNTCKVERHQTERGVKTLYVHRKGATRAYGPGHPELPDFCRAVGQPVIIGGSMGTASFILCGAASAAGRSFASACHGAGRALGRRQAAKQFPARSVLADLAERGISLRAKSLKGVGEEAPAAYKDIEDVAHTTQELGLARKIARLRPLACIKG